MQKSPVVETRPRSETTVERLYPDQRQELQDRGFTFRTGWKCLDGGGLTLDPDGKSFPTLEAARAHGKLAEFNEGLGRRVFLTDAKGGMYRSWRIRLGPDYIPAYTKTAKNPQGHGTGWGLY